MTRPGCPPGDPAARLDRAQRAMGGAGVDALFLTTEPEIRWFTGFLTRFWESPTRPWFLLVPRSGAPVAVIPEIGAALMQRGGVADIRTWPAPDPADDGVSLLAATVEELLPGGGRIALPSGMESHVRMPRTAFEDLRARLPRHRFVDDAGIMRRLRLVKSSEEIDRIAEACRIAGRAFDRVPEIAAAGLPLSEVFRRFQILCLEEGADFVPYLAGAAGPGGYADVISPATEAPLARGDVLMLDTGLVRRGYFSDFDRNWSVGPPAPEVASAHARLVAAAHAGKAAARPGALARDVFAAMAAVLGVADPGTVGRMGHGLGMQLTEWPSLMPTDETEIVPGMVLTLEPVLPMGPGRLIVHEEVVAIGPDGASWLSPPAGPEIPVLEAGG